MRNHHKKVVKNRLPQSRVAQATIEYMLVLAVVAAIVFLGMQKWLGQTRDTSGKYFAEVASGIVGEPWESEGSGGFGAPPVDNNTPPEGWELPGCYWTGEVGNDSWADFLGLDENGLPIFSDPDDYVGNQCSDVFGPPDWNEDVAGRMRTDIATGTVQIYQGFGANGSWVDFDWNNSNHIHDAYFYQRYGPNWALGCGPSGHWTDYAGLIECVFQRPPDCQEIYDSYYNDVVVGADPVIAYDGTPINVNGMHLFDACETRTYAEEWLNPDSELYVGSPLDEEPHWHGWTNFFQWAAFYNRMLELGLGNLLPFTLEDLCTAFPNPPPGPRVDEYYALCGGG